MSAGRAYDVAIIGGGVIGSAAAFFLAESSDASVVVIEADPSYATASSTLSASSIRQQFSTPVCIAMSQFGMAFLDEAPERLRVDDTPVDIGLVRRGYLYLARADGAANLERNIATQRAAGASVDRLSRADLQSRFPWLHADDLELGALGLRGEGWFDGYSLLQGFRRKAIALGVEYRTAEATGLALERGRVTGVVLADGVRLAAGSVINAAGPRAAAVARWAGLELPVSPERRCVFVVDCPGAARDWPLVIDPDGLYFRPEGAHFIAGGPATPVPDGDPFNLDVDYAQFEETIWPGLAHRAPAFETLKLLRGWAGHYEMNTFDHNALIGPAPGAPGLLLANGFSGHGMQHAAAAGRALMELVTCGGYRSLDLTALAPERVLQGRRIVEANVI